MISEKTKNQANDALRELKEAIYHTVLDHNYAKRCLTKDFSFELGWTTSQDVEIVRGILNKLKAEGLVENLEGNEEAWRPKKY
ncbi:MAG: hypothetical protein OXH59_06790 [Rhodospirillaceae bacterium]|nr:hypothetical protein [Rhodospirillaceae bacterium]